MTNLSRTYHALIECKITTVFRFLQEKLQDFSRCLYYIIYKYIIYFLWVFFSVKKESGELFFICICEKNVVPLQPL